MTLYSWPGNVRELRNAIERGVLLSRGGVIRLDHLPKRVQEVSGVEGTSAEEEGKRMDEFERAVILGTLREQNYNRSETARVLGISRRALLYKLRRFADEGFAIGPE